jgi:hypothetical protein
MVCNSAYPALPSDPSPTPSPPHPPPPLPFLHRKYFITRGGGGGGGCRKWNTNGKGGPRFKLKGRWPKSFLLSYNITLHIAIAAYRDMHVISTYFHPHSGSHTKVSLPFMIISYCRSYWWRSEAILEEVDAPGVPEEVACRTWRKAKRNVYYTSWSTQVALVPWRCVPVPRCLEHLNKIKYISIYQRIRGP